MRLRLAAALAAVFVTLAFTPARADLLIQVDKSTQQMTVSADGERLYTWPVSTGIARYDTPNGAFTPFRKEKEHYSREWDDAPMPYSIFFTMKGHAIHGTNHSNLGHPASHGCVRLSVKNASILWGLVAKQKMANTMIVLTGTIPAGDAPTVARAAPRSRTAVADPDPDDDQVASVPARRPTYGRDGWQVFDPPRAYYTRERPYYARPRGFFPFGW